MTDTRTHGLCWGQSQIRGSHSGVRALSQPLGGPQTGPQVEEGKVHDNCHGNGDWHGDEHGVGETNGCGIDSGSGTAAAHGPPRSQLILSHHRPTAVGTWLFPFCTGTD